MRGWGEHDVDDDKERKIMPLTGTDDKISIKVVTPNKSVKHVAGKIRVPQYDTIRNITGHLGAQQLSECYGEARYATKGYGGAFFFGQIEDSEYGHYPYSGLASYPTFKDFSEQKANNVNEIHEKMKNPIVTNFEDNDMGGWYNALTRYRYTFDGENFEEIVEHPELSFYCANCDMFLDVSTQVPTSNEVRPVNIAVKFFIRAK